MFKNYFSYYVAFSVVLTIFKIHSMDKSHNFDKKEIETIRQQNSERYIEKVSRIIATLENKPYERLTQAQIMQYEERGSNYLQAGLLKVWEKRTKKK